MYRQLIFLGVALLVCQTMAQNDQRCGTGRFRHRCIQGMAECVDGACVCQAPFVWGDGVFTCYRQNTVAAEVKMDPMLTTFNNESRLFPFPCRYLVTHVQQQLKNRDGDVIGTCEFKVSAFNAKKKGKFFNHGFDVATKIMYDSGENVFLSSRHYGIAENGVYSYFNEGTVGQYLPDGPWGSDNINYNDGKNGIRVKSFVDKVNHQIVYNFVKCGLRVTLVPFDIIRTRNQIAQPGLSVGINCAYKPVWKSNNDVMALAPKEGGGSYLSEELFSGLDEEQSIITRAFSRNFEQNQELDDMGMCSATSETLSKCDDVSRKNAFEKCYWMLKEPRFIKCMDKTMGAGFILRAFKKCVNVYCNGGSCHDARMEVMQARCEDVPRIPELKEFMAGDFCP